MYDLKPPHVFVHKRVYRNPAAVKRLERLLKGLGNPPIEEVDVEDTDKVIEASGAREDLPVMSGRVRQGVEKRTEDPIMLFNTFVWDKSEVRPPTKKYKNVRAAAIAQLMGGVGEDFVFSKREPSFMDRGPYVCQGGWGIHSLLGCVHKCNYCGQGYIVNMMLDLDEFAACVSRNFERRPHQKLYRYDLHSDSICFEPEYGASETLSRCFAKSGDKYLLYYTKSDNVDHLLDLPYKSNSIFYLTLATDTQARVIERDTPSTDERIDALRKCQEAGYRVRVGFSPIIPVKNWRQEATSTLERLFAKVQPETVRLWVVSMMNCAEAEILFDVSMLDPEYVEAMRRAAPKMDGKHSAPFPPEVRAEIYSYYVDEIKRISPKTPVSLCTEELEQWEIIGHKIGMSPRNLFCCCGQTSVPRK